MKLLFFVLTLFFSIGLVDAKPLFIRSGNPTSGSPPEPPPGDTIACDGGATYPDYTKVCAKFQDGQTFVTWPDVGNTGGTPGPTGGNYRYRMYRSTSTLNSGNCTSGTLIASYIFNNSGQLFGGDPTNSITAAANPFEQTYRQDAARPMVTLSDLGTRLPVFTGLQVYTALATQNSYYCIVSTNTSDGSPSYIGAAGPISEEVQTPRPIKQYDSSRAVSSRITACGPPPMAACNYALQLQAHGSSAQGGCETQRCYEGDYWAFWLPPDSGWQDGRQTTMYVGQLTQDSVPFLNMRNRTGTPSTDGLSNLEFYHSGGGVSPNPLVGVANRYYPFIKNGIQHMVTWLVDHYQANADKVSWIGKSMGAIGGFMAAPRMTDPPVAFMNTIYPMCSMFNMNSSHWSGKTWTSSMPFRPTQTGVGGSPTTAPLVLGTDASLILMPDDSPWGSGGYADTAALFSADPADEMPFVVAAFGKQDESVGPVGVGPVPDHLECIDALRTAKRGNAWGWSYGNHDNEATDGLVSRITLGGVNGDTNSSYNRNNFELTVPYIAATNSSIDDDLGTGAIDAYGIMDGDPNGCIGCGHKWVITEDSAGAFNFTFDNTWMDQGPNVNPTATLTSSIASSGLVTFTIDANPGFLSVGQNLYFQIGDTEIVRSPTISGTSITVTSSNRGKLFTIARAHSPGELVKQIRWVPNGPNAGPFSTMTVDLTPRRIQNFTKGKTNGQAITCDITPNGGSLSTQTPTVVDGHFTLTGVTINASGVTVIACD